ncbi:MAG: TolC family protein [Acidobacteriota bacterium]
MSDLMRFTIGFVISGMVVLLSASGLLPAAQLDRPAIEAYLPRAAEISHVASPESTSQPLSLEAAVRIALDQNPVQRAAREGLISATEAVGAARAARYPTVSLDAQYRRWESHAFLPAGLSTSLPTDIIGPTDDWGLGLNLRYTVFDSGQRRAEERGARAKQAVAGEDVALTRQDVIYRVHRAYYALLAAQDSLSVAKSSLGRAEDHLRLAEEKKAAGAVPLVDVVRARTEVADAKLAVVRAEGAVRVAQADLDAAIGLPADTALDLAAPDAEIDPPGMKDLTSAFDIALHSRPELKAALDRIALNQSAVDLARSSFLPKVKASARFGWRDADFVPEDKDWSVGIAVEVPVFNGYLSRHQTAAARAELRKAEDETRALVLAVQQQVTSAYSRLKEAYQAVEATRSLREDAAESARLSRERYAVGAGTLTDLLDSEAAFAKADAIMVEAHYTCRVAKVTFQKATGDLKSGVDR